MSRADAASKDGSEGGGSPRGADPNDPFAHLDPALHPETLGTATTAEGNNPLTDFAQHVLDERDNELLGFGSDEQALLAMGETRLGTLLEAAHKTERERQGLDGDGRPLDEYAFTAEEQAPADAAEEPPAEVDMDAPPPPPPTNGSRAHPATRKRRRGEDDGVVGPVENGDPIDPIKMKKDSHKEVERRRRENINDGINKISRYIPGDLKIGKGHLLLRAADYLGELTAKVQEQEEKLKHYDHEKLELEDLLARSQARYDDVERSWREAEDRAANQQFELERVKAERDDLKKQLADKA